MSTIAIIGHLDKKMRLSVAGNPELRVRMQENSTPEFWKPGKARISAVQNFLSFFLYSVQLF
jgi:hypothetical protein